MEIDGLKTLLLERRKYSEVLLGKQQKVQTSEQVDNVITIMFTLNVAENMEKVKKLEHAINAENTEVFDRL